MRLFCRPGRISSTRFSDTHAPSWTRTGRAESSGAATKTGTTALDLDRILRHYLLIELDQVVPLLPQRLDQHRRKAVCKACEYIWNGAVESLATSAHDFSVSGQKPAERIDLHRSPLHQLLSHPVHRKNRLLTFGLNRGALSGLLYCKVRVGFNLNEKISKLDASRHVRLIGDFPARLLP